MTLTFVGIVWIYVLNVYAITQRNSYLSNFSYTYVSYMQYFIVIGSYDV